jgi:hypothetical protein
MFIGLLTLSYWRRMCGAASSPSAPPRSHCCRLGAEARCPLHQGCGQGIPSVRCRSPPPATDPAKLTFRSWSATRNRHVSVAKSRRVAEATSIQGALPTRGTYHTRAGLLPLKPLLVYFGHYCVAFAGAAHATQATMACRGGVRNAERHRKCGSCPKLSHALWSAQSLPSSSTVVHLASHPTSVCADFAEFSSFPQQYSCAAASSGTRLLLMVPFLDTVSVCDLLGSRQ